MTLMMRDRENIEKGIEQRDRMLIFKWSADGRTTSEIAGLLDIPEEQVRKVQSEQS
ncbi:MAG: helix-turn-helix domain-containing protein [Clostridiales bacterium]|nr:helix-turn-helix domain-containing protein [Clostridiales bacterium]